MNYKEKYEQALERASKLRMQNPFDTVGQMVEHIFPELKESEDERIRKGLIKAVSRVLEGHKLFSTDVTVTREEALAWLEKQGEQKSADKIEPKFKAGDCIVFNGLILHIDEVVNGYYRTTSIGDGIHNSYDWDIDNVARLWTIEDAKDGDVLTNGKIIVIFNQIVEPKYKQHIEAYIGLDLGCDIQVTSESWSLGIDKAMPATKEQRETFFAKIKEAGYAWDSGKKELKKIVPKTLDADKVIKWLNDQACLGWLEDVEVEKVVEQFKKDFGL